MKRNWIRWGLILFTLVLSLCLAGAALADDVPANAPVLTPGETATATITANQLTYFKFVPSKTANYAFYSSCNEDTYAYLFTAEEGKLQEIDSNDDGGERNNFQIKRVLTEGTEYYFGVRYLSDSRAGSFPVTIEEFKGLDVKIAGNSSSFSGEIGETVNLAVEATSGKGTVTYQWSSVDEYYLWTDIQGETGASYTATAEAGRKQYNCHVTDGVTSEDVSFYVTGNDHFTAAADSDTYNYIAPHEDVTMKVKASSDTGVTFQWYKNWNDIYSYSHTEKLDGENSATCTVEDVTEKVNYYCSVKSASGTNNVWFYINIEAPITIEPVGETYRTVAQGGSTEMTVAAASVAETLTYQWYYSNELTDGRVLIDAATTATYTAENIEIPTYYTCEVRNAYGSSKSLSFNIQIEGDFGAYVNSSDHITVAPGESFSASVYTYNYNNQDTFTYQWYGPVSSKKDTAYPLSGKTESTLTIENATIAGYYFCKVTNTVGIEKTVWIHVDIESDMIINDFYADTVYANASDGATISVDATATEGVTYQWYLRDQYDGGLDTAHIIEGATGSSYTITNPQKNPMYFYCTVTDIYRNTQTVERAVSFNGDINAQAEGDNYVYVTPGEDATFTVNATGDGELTYQWSARVYTNGEWGYYREIDGATEASYTVENVQNKMELKCTVRSIFTSDNVNFNLNVDNQFRLSYVGSSYVYVEPNRAATLETEASAKTGDVSYQWYYVKNDAYGHTANIPISGATEDSYTTEPIKKIEQYYCRAEDAFGNSYRCDFTVNIDNHLEVTVAGKTTNSETREVAPGESVTMQVAANATNTEGMVYRWNKRIRNANNGWGNWQEISEVSGDTLTETVTGATDYECRVTDVYGNYEYVYFHIKINNNLSVSIAGATENEGRTKVLPGTDHTMEVSVTATNTEGMTYRWTKYNEETYNWDLIDGATGNSLTQTISNYSQYECCVSDTYGNYDYVYFYIEIENNLTATVAGKTTSDETRNVAPGTEVTLQVAVSAINTEGITYRWSRWRNSSGEGWRTIEGATGDSFTETITAYTEYQCWVRDVYGNEKYVNFDIGIENNLKVTAAGSTRTDEQIWVAPGSEATMQVTASATNMQGMTYTWYREAIDENGWNTWQTVESATGDTLTERITRTTNYRCYVRDVYGNGGTVWFYVGIENHLQATVAGKTTDEDYLTVAPGANATMQVDVTADDTDGMTYSWTKHSRNADGTWGEWQDIEDATGRTLTDSVSQYTEYHCNIRDGYGNSDSVRFYISIDNNFSAGSVGSTSVTAVAGQPAILQVYATATTGDIRYQWYQQIAREDGRDDSILITGATGASCTTEAIMRAATYYCQVSDQYGNSNSIWFTVGVENGLKVTAVGNTEPFVNPGATTTLQVSASVNAGNIHYQWYEEYLNDNGYWSTRVIPGASRATYTTEALNRRTRYYCQVNDDYGNRKEIRFYVGIQNGLKATAVGDTECTISIGGSAPLAVSASVNTGDVYYQWYEETPRGNDYSYSAIVNATAATFNTEVLSQSKRFYCRIRDDYDNEVQVYFRVNIENHLVATADGTTWDNMTFTVAPGGSAALKVNVTADDLTGITYQWYEGEWHEEVNGWYNNRMPGETGDSLTVTNLAARAMYRCEVKDKYGSSKNVYFHINIDNALVAGMTDDTVLTVVPGATTTLGVEASCAKGDLRYQWYRRYRKENGDYSSSMIPGATTERYTTESINERTEYYCAVMDDYNNSRTVNFYVTIENRLKVKSSGSANIRSGEDAEFEVQAICRKGSLTYEWFVDDTKDETATGSSYKLKNVTSVKDVRCRVTDMYGNYKDVWMGVSVQNNLWANLTATVNGTQAQIQHATGQYQYDYITVTPTDRVVLTCDAGCDEGAPSFRWYDNDDGETIENDSNVLTLAKTESRRIGCTVTDKYDNNFWLELRIIVDNGFSAVRDGAMFREVDEGASVTLKVTATAATGADSILYSWTNDEEGPMDEETTNSITVTANRNTVYRCTAKDIYGNKETIEFYITVQAPVALQTEQQVSVSIQEGSRKSYIFTPSESGNYTLFSTGSDDPYVTLYDNNGQIAYNDDGGENYNFKLTADLEAGTQYRFILGSYGNASFKMKLVTNDSGTTVTTESGYVLRPGQTARLPISGTVTVTSSNPAVVSVNGTTITANQEGAARVIATIPENNREFWYDIYVKSGPVMSLPAALTTIESEAFAQDESIRFVNLNSNTQYIGPFAFDESGLIQIVVPSADTSIAFSAFSDIQPTILCPEGSLAAIMAARYGYRYLYIP